MEQFSGNHKHKHLNIVPVINDNQRGPRKHGSRHPLPNESDIAEEENIMSYFGRINYTMADKYLATFTLRADGSSKFGDGNRWGVFPSLALAWRISEENFMKSAQKWLSNLKLRLSFGMAGNNRINSGLITRTYSMSENDEHVPYFGEDRTSALNKGTYLYNPDLKWETTTTRNIGIDYGFWNNRISGTLDFYWNTTDDLLMRSVVPSSTGYNYQYQISERHRTKVSSSLSTQYWLTKRTSA